MRVKGGKNRRELIRGMGRRRRWESEQLLGIHHRGKWLRFGSRGSSREPSKLSEARVS